MRIRVTNRPPPGPTVHVALGDHHNQGEGAVLTLCDPAAVLAVARASKRHGADWTIWGLHEVPLSEHRAASFAITLARVLRNGTVHVVFETESGRTDRIIGHLLRVGASCEL